MLRLAFSETRFSVKDTRALLPEDNPSSPVFQDFVLLVLLLYFLPLLLNNKKRACLLIKNKPMGWR